MPIGIIIVDHGSKVHESNQLLEVIAQRFADRFSDLACIVEPAHMEIADPTIAEAYERCAARGADRIIVLPFFLGPGKHWTTDIPRLAAEAAAKHLHTRCHVAGPLGVDELILDLLAKRARECLEND